MSESDCVRSMFRSGVHLWATYDLLRCLPFIAASFSFCVVHATSRAAVAAEAISRNKLVVLFDSKPEVCLPWQPQATCTLYTVHNHYSLLSMPILYMVDTWYVVVYCNVQQVNIALQ